MYTAKLRVLQYLAIIKRKEASQWQHTQIYTVITTRVLCIYTFKLSRGQCLLRKWFEREGSHQWIGESGRLAMERKETGLRRMGYWVAYYAASTCTDIFLHIKFYIMLDKNKLYMRGVVPGYYMLLFLEKVIA